MPPERSFLFGKHIAQKVTQSSNSSVPREFIEKIARDFRFNLNARNGENFRIILRFEEFRATASDSLPEDLRLAAGHVVTCDALSSYL